MPSFSDITSISTPGGTITFGSANGQWLVDPERSSGLGMGRVRAPIDNKGQTTGYILHDFLEEGMHFLLAGVLIAADAAQRNTMQTDGKTALRSIFTTTGTINGTGWGVAVKCDIGIDYPHISTYVKGFVFGLVTANPI